MGRALVLLGHDFNFAVNKEEFGVLVHVVFEDSVHLHTKEPQLLKILVESADRVVKRLHVLHDEVNRRVFFLKVKGPDVFGVEEVVDLVDRARDS